MDDAFLEGYVATKELGDYVPLMNDIFKTDDKVEAESPDARREPEPPWTSNEDKTKYHYPAPNFGEPAGKCFEVVQKWDRGMCEAWRDEIDKLLIFAGLFSAVVTSFAVDSYRSLTPDPTDVTVLYLARISLQLGNGSAPALEPPSFTPPPWSVRVNILYFLSLFLSLTTALLGILCMQWIREYQRESNFSHKDAFALRQMRYEGFRQWGVWTIMTLLPLLLQSALVLFFIGLLDFLWNLNDLVAAVLSGFIGLALFFVLATTVLPAFQFLFHGGRRLLTPQCPYKSPQAWAFYRLLAAVIRLPLRLKLITDYSDGFGDRWFKAHKYSWRTPFARARASLKLRDWTRFDGYWRAARDVRVSWDEDPSSTNDCMKGLEWLGRTLPSGSEVFFYIYQSILQWGASSVEECPPVLERMSPGSSNFLVQVLGDVRHQNNPIFDNRDVIQLLSLEHLRRDRGSQVEPALRNHALELNIRIINSINSLPEALIGTKRVTTVSCISLVNILHAGSGNWAEVPPDITDQLLLLSTSFASLVLLDQCSYPLMLFQRMVLHLDRGPIQEPPPLSLFIACKALETWMSTQPFSNHIRVKQVMECAGWVMGTFLNRSPPESPTSWHWSNLAEHPSVASLIRKSTALVKLGIANEAFASSFGRPRMYILDSSWSDFSFKGVDIEDGDIAVLAES